MKKTGDRIVRSFLIAVPVLLMGVCFWVARSRFLWLDELYSYYSTSDPSLSHSIDAISSGINASPPLYFSVTWLFYQLGFHDPIFFRLFSSLCFAFSFLLLWRLLSRYFSKMLVISVLVLVYGATELLLRQNTEFRYYGLFFLFECLAVYYATRVANEEGKSRSNLLLLGIFSACGCLTHVYGIFYGAALMVSFLLLWIVTKKRQWLPLAAIAGGMAMLVFWAPQLMRQADTGIPHSWIPPPSFLRLADVVFNFLPFGNTLERFYIPFLVAVALLIILMIVAMRSSASGKKEYVQGDGNKFLFYTALTLLLVPVILSYFISSIATSIFLTKYFVPSLIGTILAFCFTLDLIVSRWPAWGRFIFPVLLIAGLVKLISYPFQFQDDTRNVLGRLEAMIPDKHSNVIIESPQPFLAAAHYSAMNIFYPLDWAVANLPGNDLAGTSNDKIMKMVKRYYGITGIRTSAELFIYRPTYYVVDIDSYRWLEHYVASGKITITDTIGNLVPGITLKKIRVN